MRRRQIAVCSTKPGYAGRFAEFAAARNTLFAVHGFSDPVSLIDFLREHPVEILLLSEDLADTVGSAAGGRVGKIFLLTDDEYKSRSLACPAISMLDSCSGILRKVESLFAEESPFDAESAAPGLSVRRIAVYSPIGRMGKTDFAIALGRGLSKQARVLYINMEMYSGFQTLYPADGLTMSELMYFLKQGKCDFACKLDAAVRQMGSLDYIQPIKSPAEYESITGDDWELLIDNVTRKCRYEILILDPGTATRGIFDILCGCDYIYTPTAGDEHAGAKIQQYKEALSVLSMEQILERTSFFELADGEDPTAFISSECRRWLTADERL